MKFAGLSFSRIASLYLWGYTIVASRKIIPPANIKPAAPLQCANGLYFSDRNCYPYGHPPVVNEENYCRAIYKYFDGAANKGDDQIHVDLGFDGRLVAIGAHLPEEEKLKRAEELANRRIAIANEWNVEVKKFTNKLNKVILDPTPLDISPLSKESFMKMLKIMQHAVLQKHRIYIAAKLMQSSIQVGNCGENAHLAAAIVFTAQLTYGGTDTIQIFHLQHGDNDGHSFMVRNSGIKTQDIENNPKKVSKILAEIDSNPDAFLCDPYCKIQGKFSDIRNENKVYGKNITEPWPGLKIHELREFTDTYQLPLGAKHFGKVFEEADSAINALFMKNIKLPDIKENKERVKFR